MWMGFYSVKSNTAAAKKMKMINTLDIKSTYKALEYESNTPKLSQLFATTREREEFLKT